MSSRHYLVHVEQYDSGARWWCSCGRQALTRGDPLEAHRMHRDEALQEST